MISILRYLVKMLDLVPHVYSTTAASPSISIEQDAGNQNKITGKGMAAKPQQLIFALAELGQEELYEHNCSGLQKIRIK